MPPKKEQLPPSDFLVNGEQGWRDITLNLHFSPDVDSEFIRNLVLGQDVDGVDGIQSVEAFIGEVELRVDAVDPQLFVNSISSIYEGVRRSALDA